MPYQIREKRMCLFWQCWDSSSDSQTTALLKPHVSRALTPRAHRAHPERTSSQRKEPRQDSTCPLSALCTHLTWNKVDDTMQSETEVSPWATLLNTLMRQGDTAAHGWGGCECDRPLPSFHPAITSQLCSRRDSCTYTARKQTHTSTHKHMCNRQKDVQGRS